MKGKHMNAEQFKLKIIEQVSAHKPEINYLMRQPYRKKENNEYEYSSDIELFNNEHRLLTIIKQNDSLVRHPSFVVTFRPVVMDMSFNEEEYIPFHSEFEQDYIQEILRISNDKLIFGLKQTILKVSENYDFILDETKPYYEYFMFDLSTGQITVASSKDMLKALNKKYVAHPYYYDLELDEKFVNKIKNKIKEIEKKGTISAEALNQSKKMLTCINLTEKIDKESLMTSILKNFLNPKF